MAKKKNYEYREKSSTRDSDGLKQRRLKNESRWKFNPNESYESDDDTLDDMTIFDDEDEYNYTDQYRQGG